MRPLIVLVLVVAAIAAFYFAFQAGSGPEPQEPDLQGPAVTEAAPPAPKPESVDLVGDSKAEGRDAVDVASLARSTSGSSDDFDNRLTGMVVNEMNEPVADADVVLTRLGQDTIHFADQLQDRSGDIPTKTNSKGEFSFKNVPPFNGYSLRVRHADYGPTEVGQVAVAASGVSHEPPIVLSPGTRVAGMIHDAGGAPVHANVYLGLATLGAAVAGPDSMKVVSGDDGAYVFENVGPGNYEMTVVADGYGRKSIQQINVSGEDVQQDVVLEVAMMMEGRVMAAGGDPIEGATVQAYSQTNRKEQTRTQTVTNELGEFAITDVPAGSYMLLVAAEGYKPERVQRVESGEMAVLVELFPLPKITGKVVDAATNEPLKKFTVRLRESIQNMPTTVPVGKTTAAGNKEGTYVLFAPKAGTYVVEANSADYAGCFSDPVTISDSSADIPGIVVHMTKGGSIRGTLVDAAGAPIAKALVESHANDWTDDEFMRAIGDMYPTNATTRKVRSAKDGTFVLEGLTPDTYLVVVKHGDFSNASRNNLIVTEGKETDLGKIQMKRGATIRGTVYDPASQPLAGAVVTMTTTSTPDVQANYTVKTGADGAYVIEHVHGGNYSIRARRTAEAGSSPFLHWEDMKATERPLVVADDQEYHGVDFHLGATGDR